MTVLTQKPAATLSVLIAIALSGCGAEDAGTALSGNALASNANAPAASAPAANALAASAERPSRVPFIVGGSEVTHSRYPWMAALLNSTADRASDGQFCGGSLIASRWVLTAAHCVEQERADTTDVLIGQRDLTASGGERIGVSRIIIHPDYQQLGYPDLALLELSEDSRAPVISLPTQRNPVPQAGETATVIGWGQISETGPATTELRETDMPVVAHDSCNAAYNGEINEQAMVCAGSPSGDRDSCYGDSGGPLFVQRSSEFVQAGVVSFGEACGLPGVPGVYARVSSYHDWIDGYADITTFGADSPPPPVDAGPDTDNPATETDSPEVGVVDESDTDADFDHTDFDLDYDWDEDFDADQFDEDFDSDAEWEAGDWQAIEDWDDQAWGADEDVDADNNDDDFDQQFPAQADLAVGPWQFTGALSGWWDEAYEPREDGLIAMEGGTLSITLTVPADQPFVVFLDGFDMAAGEWFDMAGAVSQNGVASLTLDIAPGYYSFGVLSLGDGGDYTLEANLQTN